jgi:hypothetical protein
MVPGAGLISVKKPSFSSAISLKKPVPGKNDPHIRIPAGFLRYGWGKLGGKIRHDVTGFGGH